MKEWKYTVELGDLHRQYNNGEICITEVAYKLSERLESLLEYFPDDWNLNDMIDFFAEIENVTEYDDWLECLYNWADKNNVWISTF
ncbi:hypothetical protein [Scytonema sp. NUACC26]|uniref:hypothetical protein n=1 Tax=Scytonema sp. NUACC26 TaxID=3140176 RepID=UPI0034DBB664